MIVTREKLGYHKLVLSVDLLVFALLSFVISTVVYNVSVEAYLFQLAPALIVVGVSTYLLSVFEITLNVSLSSLLSRTLMSVILALSILLVLIYILGPGSGKNVYGRGVLFFTMSGFCIYLLATRYYLYVSLRAKKPFHHWIFVGSERRFEQIKRETKELHRHDLVRQTVSWLQQNLGQDPEMGFILDDDLYKDSELSDRLINAKFRGIKITSVDQFYESFLEKIPLFHVQESWFLSTAGFGYINDSIRQRVKRTMELTLIILTLPITLLVFFITAILILVFDRQNPVFYQQRIGQHGREFSIYKLRTMANNKETDNGSWTSENDTRVTAIGKILRRYRLDEIPQLFNVLCGQMNIIGPRPEQPEYTKLLEQKVPFYDIRHAVKPGITGWAQVKYAYGSSVEDSRAKLEYDLYYIKNYSLLLDLTIMIKTAYTIFSGSGR